MRACSMIANVNASRDTLAAWFLWCRVVQHQQHSSDKASGLYKSHLWGTVLVTFLSWGRSVELTEKARRITQVLEEKARWTAQGLAEDAGCVAAEERLMFWFCRHANRVTT